MVCPFRIEKEYRYNGDISGGNTTFLVTKEIELFPPCMYDACPFYEETFDGSPSCNKTNVDD